MSLDLSAALVTPRRWLVTGAAGFIGSHLVQALLRAGQRVVGVDNFVTGHQRNLDAATRGTAGRFEFLQGDLVDLEVCRQAVDGVEVVLHQAALGSVPRSLENPLASHRANVDGFIHLLEAARGAGVKRVVYASSSSVYGDDVGLPKVEARTGRPLSPYAATKSVNEVYAGVFQRCYGLEAVGLRYFNVFGPRQDPEGPYAAVIPRWFLALRQGQACHINGDGAISRDFCFVDNAVQANLRAGLAPGSATGRAYNVAVGARTSLTELYWMIHAQALLRRPALAGLGPVYGPPRPGDIQDSQADTSLAREHLGYAPTHSVAQGLESTAAFYLEEES